MKYWMCIMFELSLFVPLLGQWERAVKLTQSGKASPGGPSCIAASLGGLVHVVWCDVRSGKPQIYYRRASNGGLSWGDEVRLTATSGRSENPAISIAGAMNPVIHVVWDDDRDGNREIYYNRSTDWGITWLKDHRLTDAVDSSTQPVVQGCVCCGAYVRVAWIDKRNGNKNIYYKYSTDNGITWSEDAQVSRSEFSQVHPAIAFSCSLVQVVWTDFRDARPEIWGRRSFDDGENWEAETCLSSRTSGWAAFPAIAHFDSSLHLFWTGCANRRADQRFDIYYEHSRDLGSRWDPEIRLSNHEMIDSFPYLSCANLGSAVHLVWQYHQTGIYYLRSTDNGMTWNKEERIAPVTKGKAWGPSVAVEGKNVHVVWCEENKGNKNIYYKRNPAGNPIFSK